MSHHLKWGPEQRLEGPKVSKREKDISGDEPGVWKDRRGIDGQLTVDLPLNRTDVSGRYTRTYILHIP